MRHYYKIGLCFLLFVVSDTYCFSYVYISPAADNKTEAAFENEDRPVYLDKNDPIYKTIKAQAITNLKQCWQKADPESAQNKEIKTKMKTWPKEKQDQVQALFEKCSSDYAERTGFDVETFMMVFEVLGKMDQKQIEEEYDIRVLSIGGNQYVAEFFEDGIAVNSEAHAMSSTNDPEYQQAAKKTYANVRKAIKEGKQERYSKVMALLYTQEKNNSVIFNDPAQPMYDFIEKEK